MHATDLESIVFLLLHCTDETIYTTKEKKKKVFFFFFSHAKLAVAVQSP